MRVEHWTNAAEQGVFVGQRLLQDAGAEAPQPFAPVPFVWSDQYDVKIQIAGRFSGQDRMEVVHGSLDAPRFVAIFERGGRISGVLGFSEARRVDAVPAHGVRAGDVRGRARIRCRRLRLSATIPRCRSHGRDC